MQVFWPGKRNVSVRREMFLHARLPRWNTGWTGQASKAAQLRRKRSVLEFCTSVGFHRGTRASRGSTVRRRGQRPGRTLHAALWRRRRKWDISITLISSAYTHSQTCRPTTASHGFITLVTVYVIRAIKMYSLVNISLFMARHGFLKKKKKKQLFTCGTFFVVYYTMFIMKIFKGTCIVCVSCYIFLRCV